MLNISISKRLQLTILATRPWSFSMTVISVTLGNIVALSSSSFHWGRYGLVLAGMILVHAATNVLNDYFDFRHGLDMPGSPTTLYRRHPLVEKDFTPRFILGLSLSCYAGAALIGLYFTIAYGWIIFLFALIGGLTSIFYTADPVKYKQRAMGEIAVFVMWGPLMMSASHFIQTKSWEHLGTVLLVSIPQGLWVALVLLANNLKDIEYDQASTIKTLGTLLGRGKAMGLYLFLVAGIYGITLLETLIGVIPLWGVLTFLSLPMILKLIGRLYREPAILPDAEPQTAQTGMVYGVLLIISFLLSLVV